MKIQEMIPQYFPRGSREEIELGRDRHTQLLDLARAADDIGYVLPRPLVELLFFVSTTDTIGRQDMLDQVMDHLHEVSLTIQTKR